MEYCAWNETDIRCNRQGHGYTWGIFKLVNGGSHAVRVPVKFGRASVSTIEVLERLAVGDTIIINDMTQYDSHPKLRIR